MKLLGKFEMRSPRKIAKFCETEHVGRIATIDSDGCPQIIPMNFVLLGGFVYMHSHIHGEKLENIVRNNKVGFEIDRELEFLPSYFTHPTDASVADTLYISVVMKGVAHIISNDVEKCMALNGLMTKYQPEGGYEPVKPTDDTLDYVTVIRITPNSIRGKYKIGQHLQPRARISLAQNILRRSSTTAMETLKIMGFAIRDGNVVQINDEKW